MYSNHLSGYNHLNYISFSIFVIYLIGSFRFLWVTIKLFIRSSRLQNISGPFFPPKCLSWTFRSIRFLKVKIQITLAVLFKFSKNSLYVCEGFKLFKNNGFTSFLTSSESILKLNAVVSGLGSLF